MTTPLSVTPLHMTCSGEVDQASSLAFDFFDGELSLLRRVYLCLPRVVGMLSSLPLKLAGFSESKTPYRSRGTDESRLEECWLRVIQYRPGNPSHTAGLAQFRGCWFSAVAAWDERRRGKSGFG